MPYHLSVIQIIRTRPVQRQYPHGRLVGHMIGRHAAGVPRRARLAATLDRLHVLVAARLLLDVRIALAQIRDGFGARRMHANRMVAALVRELPVADLLRVAAPEARPDADVVPALATGAIRLRDAVRVQATRAAQRGGRRAGHDRSHGHAGNAVGVYGFRRWLTVENARRLLLLLLGP